MLDNQTFTEYAKGSLVESLYGNRYKFYRMIDRELEPFDKSSEEFEDPSSNMGDDIIIFRRSIYRYIKKERLSEICDACGFLASFHKSDVWITPDNFGPDDYLTDDNFEIDEKSGLRVAWHVSPIGDLDVKGIRCRSREKDPDFDIYHGRIYLMGNEESINHAYTMVSDEHDNPTGHTYLYKILIPKGYKVYPDPTTRDGGFVVNNIPPQFITKTNDDEENFDMEWKEEWRPKKKKKKKEIDPIKKLIRKAKNLKEFDGIKLESTMNVNDLNLDEANDWTPSSRDIRMLNQGRKPAWAKKVTELGPRQVRRTSNDPSELAMRRVTEPGYKNPSTESDLKAARQSALQEYQNIAKVLETKINAPIGVSPDCVTVNTPNCRYLIYNQGFEYKIRAIYNAVNQKYFKVKTLAEVASIINEAIMASEAVTRLLKGEEINE